VNEQKQKGKEQFSSDSQRKVGGMSV